MLLRLLELLTTTTTATTSTATTTCSNHHPPTTTVTNDTTTVKIARAIGNYGNLYVDEFALFDEELNNTQVTDIYNSGTPIDLSSHSDLVGYWRMGENDSSPTISDLSGQGNDMTLINSPTISSEVPPT